MPLPTLNIAICIMFTDIAMVMQMLPYTNTDAVNPERRIPSKRVFTRVEQSLRDNGCLPSFVYTCLPVCITITQNLKKIIFLII